MSMKTSNTRIPRTLPEFDRYIHTVVTFLLEGGVNSNGIRLGLLASEIKKAQIFFAQWYTGNAAAPGAYELHTSPNTRTKATTVQVNIILRSFSDFFRPLLTRMSGSGFITSSDRLILNIAPPNDHKSKPRLPFIQTVYFTAQALGGGVMKVTCRTVNDSKRASKPKGADIVEICYKTGGPPPSNAGDADLKTLISTHAVILLQTGPANGGNRLHAYARWSNTHHPELAGPWSVLLSVFIS